MDNENMSNDYYSDGSHKPKSRVGKILRWAGLAIVLLVYVLLFFRIYIKGNPKSASEFLWTPEAVAAYKLEGENFVVKTQKIESYNKILGYDENNVPIVERVIYNDITGDGSFQISELMYVPSTKEVQVTLRFNRSSLDKLKDEYKLSERPDGEIFFFALDSLDGNYYTDYSYTASKRFTYEYRRLVFKNVDLDAAELMYLNIYYIDDVRLASPLTFTAKDEDNSVHCTLPIYDRELGFEVVKQKKYLPAEENTKLQTPPYVVTKD